MIFCVEDDSSIRDLMIYTLHAAGFEARGFVCDTDFSEALQTEKPELILLDIMLPGEDGISILKRLKSNRATSDIPVIMATARGTEYDKVWGLDLGADDYLVKPFGMMEMVSRVRAVLRRAEPRAVVKLLRVGNIELNVDEHTVYVCGERIVLTRKEYDLLCLFMQYPGRIFTRDVLLDRIWESDYVGATRTVDVHIRTLRTKLMECGDYIETIRGVGYRMEGKL